MSRILIFAVLLVLTIVSIYSAHISGRGQNVEGLWLFTAFSLFFSIPLIIVVIRALGEKSSAFRKLYNKLAGSQQEGIKFVPHWFMVVIIGIFGIIAVVNIIRVVLWFVRFRGGF